MIERTFDTGVMAPDLDAALTLSELSERIRPTVLSSEKTVPVVDELRGLLPLGGLVRGSSVAVSGTGATSLALTLLGKASGTGSWIAVVGVDSLGWAAVARAGWALDRTVSITEPPVSAWATVVGALVDALDVVVVDPTHQVRAGDARRLAARTRERGSILVRLETPDGRSRFRWPTQADLHLTSESLGWEGVDVGAGHLRSRPVTVAVGGRRQGGRPASASFMLPGDRHSVETVPAPVTPLGRIG